MIFGTQLCKTQILTRYLFSALKNFLLHRSGITKGPYLFSRVGLFGVKGTWWQKKTIFYFPGFFYLMRVASLSSRQQKIIPWGITLENPGECREASWQIMSGNASRHHAKCIMADYVWECLKASCKVNGLKHHYLGQMAGALKMGDYQQ